MNKATKIDIEDLDKYIIIGVDQEGIDMLAASPKLTLEAMGALHGRLGVAIQARLIEGVISGMKAKKGKIIH